MQKGVFLSQNIRASGNDKNSFDELPKIISTTVNLYKGNNNIKKSVLEIGTKITPDLFKIRRAYNSSTKVFKEYKTL